MRLLKKEKDALSALLQAGAETPGALVDIFVKELDRLRGERDHIYACAIVAGIPLTVGPFSTRNQAEKALTRIGAQKAWIVPGWTSEGWDRHLESVDAPPVRSKPNAKEQAALDKAFWGKFWEREGDGPMALVGRTKQDIEIKPVSPVLLKGAWG